jgi:hypothetical protein
MQAKSIVTVGSSIGLYAFVDNCTLCTSIGNGLLFEDISSGVQRHAWGGADDGLQRSSGVPVFAADPVHGQVAMQQPGASSDVIILDAVSLCVLDKVASSADCLWEHIAFSADGNRLLAVSVCPQATFAIWLRSTAQSAFSRAAMAPVDMQLAALAPSFFPGLSESSGCVGACT